MKKKHKLLFCSSLAVLALSILIISMHANSAGLLNKWVDKKATPNEMVMMTKTHSYKYELTLTGRLPNAVVDSTFVVLTHDPNLTFEQVAKSVYSSDLNDKLDIVIL